MSKQEHDAAVAEYRQEISTFEKPWYRSSSELLSQHSVTGLKCLDLCCGNGEFSHILKEKHNMEVVCADYIDVHLENMRHQGFEAFQVDIDASRDAVDAIAEQYAEKFDLVVNLAAIEHVFNSDNLLRFAHKVLKKDGLLLINTPNIAFAGYRLYSLLGGNRPFGEGHHIRFWDYRFLRTNLYLTGFTIFADGRDFYSLPQDSMLRGFRNRKRIAAFVAWLFHGCKVMKQVPGFRSLCCDELTVLARRDDVPSVGFELNSNRRFWDGQPTPEIKACYIERLRKAKEFGWLDEHLYLSKFVDDLD